MFVAGKEGGAVLPVKRTDLITKLKANLTKHQEEYKTAVEGFRAAVIKDLEGKLRRARKGEDIELHIPEQAPEDHSEDYERTIGMLEMCTEEKIFISEQEYRQYVMDKWSWKDHSSNAMYAVAAVARKKR